MTVALSGSTAARDLAPAQLALIRRTVAADTNDDEFDLFIEVCRRVGLDAFRKQIHAVVYNKNDDAKRKMSIITAIDGFRAVAARNRDYRPDDAEPVFEIDESLKSDENPLGLIKAVVRAYKLAPDGKWHPVVGVAYWTEFAPITEEADGYDWIDTGEVWRDSGKPKKKKVPRGDVRRVPAQKWATMPHVMLAKCAEAQALRKGWPEDLSGIYAAEEMDRARFDDVSASEVIIQHQREERLKLVHAKDSVPLMFGVTSGVEMVPTGKVGDRIAQEILTSKDAAWIEAWRDMNRAGLQQFWAMSKADALEVKKAIERRLMDLRGAGRSNLGAG